MQALKLLSGVPMPLADGLTTSADLFLPDDGERHPVLLSRTPYSRALTSLHVFNPLRAARRGYAVVIADCRGRFSGQGAFHPFRDEDRDGRTAVEWCRAQPWSDGRVGMWGSSYVGATQLLTALERPEGLAAVSPSFTAADYRSGWLLEGEILQQHFLQTWSAALGSTNREATREAVSEFRTLLADGRAFRRPLDAAFSDEALALVPHYAEWLAHRDDAGYWAALSIEGRHDRIAAAGLHIGGWYDVFAEGTLANFAGMSTEAGESGPPQRLVMGPWEHAQISASVGEVNFGLAAGPVGADLPGKQLAFFDESLRDAPPSLPPVSAFVMGANHWASFDQWPPPGRATTWFLGGQTPHSASGDGSLRFDAPETQDPWRLLFDPVRPVPTRGGRIVAPGEGQAGPWDQRAVESRDDVLVFTSEPFAQATVIGGTVRAVIDATSTSNRWDVCVTLTEVDPAGRSLNIVDGAARSIEPGRRELEVLLGSTAYCVRPGHRLRIRVSASNHPRLELSGSAPDVREIFAGRSRVILPLLG